MHIHVCVGKKLICIKRRRSFHDLDSFRNLEVLSPTRMKIDVELCGQCLIMWRREEHLKNVIACVDVSFIPKRFNDNNIYPLQLLSKSLSNINTTLHSHVKSHLDDIEDLAERCQVLLEMDEESHRAERFSQAFKSLEYESAQFNLQDLRRAASASRRRVFKLREKVFGLGGVPGVGTSVSMGIGIGMRGRKVGASMGPHGPFNRLLWTLDGRTEVVDYLGRTESEAAEERRIDPEGLLDESSPPEEEVEEEEEERDVVELPGIKPMWLLRFFTSWRARWSAAVNANQVTLSASKEEDRESDEAVLNPLEVGNTTPAIVSNPLQMERLP